MVAPTVEDVKRRVLGSSPGCRKKLKGVLVEGEVPEHLQSTAKLPLSKVPIPQILRYSPAMSWRLIQECILPSSTCSWDSLQQPPLHKKTAVKGGK